MSIKVEGSGFSDFNGKKADEKLKDQDNKYSKEIDYLKTDHPLEALGRSMVHFRGAVDTKENEANETETPAKEITEEDIKNAFQGVELNEFNIPLAKKILSDERLFSNPDFIEGTASIIKNVTTKEQAEAKIMFLDKILSDKRYTDNSELTYCIHKMLSGIKTTEQYKLNMMFLDKILSHIKQDENGIFADDTGDNLVLNPFFQRQIVFSINQVSNFEQYRLAERILSDENAFNTNIMTNFSHIVLNKQDEGVRFNFLDKILSDERLCGNKEFMENFSGGIIAAVSNQYQLQPADKILSDERLINNHDFMKYAGGIIAAVSNQYQLQPADKILSDESLINNHDFMKYAGDILRNTETKEQAEVANRILSDERLTNNPEFMDAAGRIVSMAGSEEEAKRIINFLDNYEKMEILPKQMLTLLDKNNKVSLSELKALNKTIGYKEASKLSSLDTAIAAKFIDVYGKTNINEIPIYQKRDFLRNLVSSNTDLFNKSETIKKMFPLIPDNKEEYCSILPSIVRSLGIETNVLNDDEANKFNKELTSLSDSLAKLSDEEFNNLNIVQEYSRDEFIQDILSNVKGLSRNERQKLYDYFGFELHHNRRTKTGFAISGYPVNLNNGKKLAQITDPITKETVEKVRPYVIRFSEQNKIKCSNSDIEASLNEIAKYLPEIHGLIGKVQAGNEGLETKGSHNYDIFSHSLKVMQKISRDERFNQLNDSDKKLMLLASLMHDITKIEGHTDKTHANEGAFDTYFIAKKFNLSRDEEIKLYTLIKNHEWLGYVNSADNKKELEKRLKSTAYDLRHDNILDLLNIFSHADLKAVKFDDSFHDKKEGKSRVDFEGNVRSFGEACDYHTEKLKGYIDELKKSQPMLPVTKIPSADRIKQNLMVNPDGSTNYKGIYVDDDGLVVVKFNEVENETWEKIGFPKGSISKGIKTTTSTGEEVDTGNIKFIAHGLDYSNQLINFDAFPLINSDALLSVSYTERPESKYRFFRPQGILLDVDTKYIHGGGDTDSGSGCGKDINNFKENYIFGGYREHDRLYISNLIKEALNLSDEEYIEFVKENENKSLGEIEPDETREKLIKAFASINSNTRKGEREYNEMYVSNPKPPMAVFAYSIDYNEKIDNPLEFLKRDEIKGHEQGFGTQGELSVKNRTEFLREYALDRNLPFFVFGD